MATITPPAPSTSNVGLATNKRRFRTRTFAALVALCVIAVQVVSVATGVWLANFLVWTPVGVSMGFEARHWIPVQVVAASSDAIGTGGTARLRVSNDVWLKGRTWCEVYGTTRPASASDLSGYTASAIPPPAYVAYSSGTVDYSGQYFDASVPGPALGPFARDKTFSVRLALLPKHRPIPLTSTHLVATCYFVKALPPGYGQ